MVIYADVLVFSNLLIDGAMMASAVRLAGCPPCKAGRLFTSALTGGLSSLVILLPSVPFRVLLLLRVGSACLMSFLALGLSPPFTYWTVTALYYGLSVLLAGILELADGFLSPAGLYLHNQQAYFNLSFFQLIFLVTGLYLAVRGFSLLRRRGGEEQQEGMLSICFRGRQVTLKALSDSGNLLRDPGSGRPVAICSLSALRPLFEPELKSGQNIPTASGLFEALAGIGLPVRLIPYHGVGAGGLLPVFLPDRVIWSAGKRRKEGDWAVGILPSGTGLAGGREAIVRLTDR